MHVHNCTLTLAPSCKTPILLFYIYHNFGLINTQGLHYYCHVHIVHGWATQYIIMKQPSLYNICIPIVTKPYLSFAYFSMCISLFCSKIFLSKLYNFVQHSQTKQVIYSIFVGVISPGLAFKNPVVTGVWRAKAYEKLTTPLTSLPRN